MNNNKIIDYMLRWETKDYKCNNNEESEKNNYKMSLKSKNR